MKELQLTRGYVALVDDDVFEYLNKRMWQARPQRTTIYGRCRMTLEDGSVTYPYLHQVIMGTSLDGLEIDHKDGDGLNNQRSNLRFATRQQNSHNTRRQCGKAAPKGVHWANHVQRWVAQITIGGVKKHIGCFDTDAEAHKAYVEAASAAQGEFFRHDDKQTRRAVIAGVIRPPRRTYTRKLTEEQRRQVVEWVASGTMSRRAASRALGVSLPTVLRILKDTKP